MESGRDPIAVPHLMQERAVRSEELDWKKSSGRGGTFSSDWWWDAIGCRRGGGKGEIGCGKNVAVTEAKGSCVARR